MSPLIDKLRKKVFILTNTLESGGAEKQSILLAKSLQDDFETRLIVYYGNQNDPKLKALAEKYYVEIIWLHGSHVAKIYKLYLLFRKNRNAFVFSFLATTNVLNAVIGSFAHIHHRIGGIRNEKLSGSKMFLQKFLHNYLLTCTVFNNFKGMDTLCSKGFRKEKSYVIHNCMDISIPLKMPEKSKTQFILLSVGRFVEQKDHFTAINAFSQLVNLIHDNQLSISVKFIIIGYGPLENEIKDHISQKNLHGLVEVVINPLDLDHYYSNADIYLSTSLFEGLSNTIMEAMEHSLPVVATKVGDNNFIVKEKETGYLRDVGAVDQLAMAIFNILSDYNLRRKMSENAYCLLRDNFSPETFRNKYLNLMNHLESGS